MANTENPEEPTTLPLKRTSDSPQPEPKKSNLNPPEPELPQEEETEANGKEVVDRKGKGILIEDEGDDDEEEGDEDDDDDSDSDSDSNSDSGIGDCLSDDSEFADDPLAEVDLDNILPSRTRRKVIHPGVYIKNDRDANQQDDDSDDPDA